VAVTVALPLELMLPAAAVNVAVVAFAGTVTEAGTVSEPPFDDRDTVAPPVGAALDSVTVQVLVALEARVVGEH
jgi:hypothetical protein